MITDSFERIVLPLHLGQSLVTRLGQKELERFGFWRRNGLHQA
jgi:hypothetical protein